MKPNVLIFSGYGLNCEEETKFAFELAGAKADIVHINDLIEKPKQLKNYQILAIPGGFSYGDDTGSGKAYANKLKNNLWDELKKFSERDTLAIGICNGFQILTNLRLLPGALTFNDNARYTDRWVDIKIEGQSPWLSGIRKLSLPIAHGEGKYFADEKTLLKMNCGKEIAARYTKGEICEYQNLKSNPNGAIEDIAGILGFKGRVLGMMPHPERAMFFTQLPNWPYLKEKYLRENIPLPHYADGIRIFENGVNYFL
ncbi:phosphoribosylformylglycinamidine synthase subunit PurQ [Candidatus Wolfebacteria bacterium]|nr:phosphoribosylformylglycinamidine synthase subunit PurQ [Candidatus Wolfebacteria bacterium]